jgi:hypothetical protein
MMMTCNANHRSQAARPVANSCDLGLPGGVRLQHSRSALPVEDTSSAT